MASWQRHLRMNPEWEQAKDGEITRHQLAATIAGRLRELRPFSDENIDETRINLAEEFEWLSGDPETDTEDFDALMDALYDWGDIRLDDNWNGKKVCWIDTIGITSPIPLSNPTQGNTR